MAKSETKKIKNQQTKITKQETNKPHCSTNQEKENFITKNNRASKTTKI